MILPHLLFFNAVKAQVDCSFAGFPCCQNPVPSPVYDNNRYGYGTENGKSCILASSCESCAPSQVGKTGSGSISTAKSITLLVDLPRTCAAWGPPQTTVKPPAPTTTTTKTTIVVFPTTVSSSTTSSKQPQPTSGSQCSYAGFACCLNPVDNPQYDSNGVGYGFENSKSCILAPDCTACLSPSTAWGFATRQGTKLFDGTKQIRFVSWNIPNLIMLEDRPSSYYFFIPPDPWEQNDAMLTMDGFHARVGRTYTLGFGKGQHVTAARTYNEVPFVAMDHAIAAARRYKIRLIIPLINNHKGSDSNTDYFFGDYGILCSFRGIKPSQFYTSQQMIDDMKHLISYVLNRVNTVTKIAYKDDPTILAWQLGNELGSWFDPPAPASWAIEMSKHLKSIAPKTLVMDGTIGGASRIPQESLKSPYIDIFTNHYYGGPATPAKDAKLVASYNKAFIVGEYGLQNNAWYDQFAEATINTPEVTGSLIWSLRYHSYEGGFYKHSEGNGYLAYHAPGFPPADGFHAEEEKLIPKMRYYSLLIQGLNVNTPHPVPNTPVAAHGTVTPKALRWGGSAWAKGYNIERQEVGSTTWTRIASNVMDNVIGPKPIYSDTSASTGKSYRYRIQGVGVDGKTSDWGIIGPMIA